MAKVKVEVDEDSAAERLKAIKKSLKDAKGQFDSFQRDLLSFKRPKLEGKNGAPASGATKALYVAAIAVVATKVAEAVTSALSQELDKRGFAFLAEQLDDVSRAITATTTFAQKISSAIATADNVARPFAESGAALSGEALLGAAKIGWARAQREAEADRRRTGRTPGLYADTAVKIAQQL